MIRLLVQFKNDSVFGGNELELLDEYTDPNKAVKDGLSIYDNTVHCMFINRGKEYLRIK
jgi:hypothetical protein